jgi:hypothetical protein
VIYSAFKNLKNPPIIDWQKIKNEVKFLPEKSDVDDGGE